MRRLARAALAALILLGPPARAETLADALAYGYEASGLIEQNRALLRAADEGVAQAVAALRPIVNWSSNLQATYPTSALAANTVGDVGLGANIGLSLSLTLYDGGANRLAVDQQKELVLATRESLRAAEQQVLLRIVVAYLELQRVGAFVQLRENNVRLIAQELRAAEDRFEVGEVTRTDVALAQSALAAAQSLLAAEQGNGARAIEEFGAAVGRAPDDPQPANAARIEQGVDAAKAVALRSQPSIRQGQHEVAAAELAILRARAALSPSVSLSGQIALDEEATDSTQLGLSLGGPIYQGGAIASAIRQAQAQRDAQRGDLLETARAVEQNVGNAYSLLEVSRWSRGAYREQVRAAQIAFDGVREEAALGARTTLDVLDAEQELRDARANQISAEIDEVLATYQVLSSMGMLTAENLGLRVQLYDPSAYYNLVDDAPAALSAQGRALDRVLEAIGD